mgnify:CR=1 FL=1
MGVLILLLGVELGFLKNNVKKMNAKNRETSYINLAGGDEPKLDIPPETVTPVLDEMNLMIVAHPDDETLWGGAHLLNDKYYVVCVTCGNVDYRDREFKTIMEKTQDEYTFLKYPDLVGGHISNWENDIDNIKNDLDKIIKSRNWKTIVTHNPEGEYGHFHHKTLSFLVTKLFNDKDRLFYFGKYYADNVPEMPKIGDTVYNSKINDLVSVYKSQPKAVKRHYHMLQYENFVQYKDWY